MARTTAPLFSMDASGTVAGAIVFSRWRGRNYVRRHAIPVNPRTPLQTGVRSAFRFLTQEWKNVPTNLQAAWVALGDITRVTGLNALVADNVRRLREGRPWTMLTAPVSPAAPTAVGVFSATALARAIQLDWTRPSSNSEEWGIEVHMALGTGFTPSIATLIYAVPIATVQLIVTGLTPGTPYYFVLRPFGTTFAYAAETAEFTATPTT